MGRCHAPCRLGESGLDDLCFVDVVVSDNGNILRYAYAASPQHAHCADGHQVIGGRDGIKVNPRGE